ncbi:MAG: hypothetical protein LC776_02435 [Acidobacteria bacterium]|nr:hypothetical protein [Acidobacteriota bacterium]
MTVKIDVDLSRRVFTVDSGRSNQRFKIPEGYDIRVSDMKQIVETVASFVRVDPRHWWEFHHDRQAERNRYKTSRFNLVHVGARDFGQCYVEWMCDAEGYERGYGYRGNDAEDWLGGIITDQEMDGLSYSLANNEEHAIENGYSLKGYWHVRVLEDDETDALVQARVSASWSKPTRWTAIPVVE